MLRHRKRGRPRKLGPPSTPPCSNSLMSMDSPTTTTMSPLSCSTDTILSPASWSPPKKQSSVYGGWDTGYNKQNVHVSTPPALYAALDSIHHFDYDPCPLHSTEDLFSRPWGNCNFVNPPYKETARWIERALAQNTKKSVFLIPFRGDRFYWHRLVWPNACSVTQLMGGIRFGNYKQAFPGPMAIVVFDPAHAGPVTNASLIVHPYENRPAIHLYKS